MTNKTTSFPDPGSNVVAQLLRGFDPLYGFGMMSCNVYDTAWVACISKSVAGRRLWWFPNAFYRIIESQRCDGSWSPHFESESINPIDTILVGLAALYCLLKHQKQPLQLETRGDMSLGTRIELAVAHLTHTLQDFRICDCEAVGFEILVPSLIELLTDEGVQFEFPEKDELFALRNMKLTKVPPELLYKHAPIALLHSLEAFHNRQDFRYDQIAQHKVQGSLMGSPSATASYLINSSQWDDEAEAYLHLVISNGEGKGSGAVPSAFPSTIFEITWVISTLLECHVWTPSPTSEHYEVIFSELQAARNAMNGLVGFSRGIEPDLDDSAKTSIIFSLTGKPGFSRAIVSYFDSDKCLKTYRNERNPSVSANANALLSLILDSEQFTGKFQVICKVASYLCDALGKSSEPLRDKWNTSPYYPTMLIINALCELLGRWDQVVDDNLTSVSFHTIYSQVCCCVTRTVALQGTNGSWGQLGPYEETAYVVIMLAKFLALAPPDRDIVTSAIKRGRDFLKRNTLEQPEHLWIEKVTYGSVNLNRAYITAALFTPLPENETRIPIHPEVHYQ